MPGERENKNVLTSIKNDAGEADYVLLDSNGFPLCTLEAKRSTKSPLIGKEQARKYAQSLKSRFIILSNGNKHYLWDTHRGSPFIIETIPSQKQLEMRVDEFNPKIEEDENIDYDYIAKTQFPNYALDPDYKDNSTKNEFIKKNKLKFLRQYQINAINTIKENIKNKKERFLLEMATGTGKTLVASAIIKMFIRLYGVKRILFLVDRIELEDQAKRELNTNLSNDYLPVIWKENKSDWRKAEIVISTVQSLISRNKFKQIFNHNDFDLVISDEAHRSLGTKSRRVFEFFNGFKLGLTATPKNFLRGIDITDLGEIDPRQLEKRFLLDTYTLFGCEKGVPTFRYSLEDGVKDGYLINPKVFDARTEITTELLSENGFIIETKDDDGNDLKEIISKNAFEKKFFSRRTNRKFCETFLRNAKRDPYTNEIGKTLIFCVSQNHAAKITQILNEIADEIFPDQFQSNFAIQVTSDIKNSQQMTIKFSDKNNNLSGYSDFNRFYRTSKTRVCVTVGMMTTGYDCSDILNICLIRPIYSPYEFIQMKGRGTRKNDFKEHWITDSNIPIINESEKKEFFLFDFMGNYEYFEKDFNYDERLKIPSDSKGNGESINGVDEIVLDIEDPLKILDEISLGNEVMKIDKDLYPSFKKNISKDQKLRQMVEDLDFKNAENYLMEKMIKEDSAFDINRLKSSLGLKRSIKTSELLLYTFDYQEKIKDLDECLEEEFERLDQILKPSEEYYSDAKQFFITYILDKQYRAIIDNKKFADLNFHPSGNIYKKIPKKLQEEIPSFIKQNINIEELQYA